jgi:hypothetical protein
MSGLPPIEQLRKANSREVKRYGEKVEPHRASNSKRAAREFFLRGDSRINGNMIHAGDGDFGVAFVGA